MILVHLENIIRKITKNKDAKIVDYFDFFAGTSTGAVLISLLLCPDDNDPTKTKYDAQDAVNLYLKHGSDIFRTTWLKRILSKFFLTSEKFDPMVLEHLFEQYFGETKLSRLVKPCIIPAYNIELRKAHFFKQHLAIERGDSKDFLLKDICRATTAAPGYFHAAEVFSTSGTRYPLIDGGIFANNPTLIAFMEVSKMEHRMANPGKRYVLSLGTGAFSQAYPYHLLRNTRTILAVPALMDMMMSGISETTDFIAKQIFKIADSNDHYLRINPSNLSSINNAIDDATPLNIQKLKALGERMASEYYEELEIMVNHLIEMKELAAMEVMAN
jgi:hypothetical protein